MGRVHRHLDLLGRGFEQGHHLGRLAAVQTPRQRDPDAESESAQQSAQQAEQSMQRAEDQMQNGDSPTQAAEDAEDARKYLDEVKEQLEEEQRRYESLQQEEMLYRLVRDLREIKKQEEEIRKSTAGFIEVLNRRGRLPRPDKKKVKRIAQTQDELADKIKERQKAVKEEESTAFASVLEGVGGDMEEIAAMLRDLDLGPVVLGLEDEVIQRIDDLIGGFTDVIKQKQQPPGEGQEPPPPGQKPPLVPAIVEIKLLRRLQQDLNRKIEGFWRRNPDVKAGEVDDRQKRTLERLSHQQARLKRILDALIKQVFGNQGGPGGPQGGDDEGGGEDDEEGGR